MADVDTSREWVERLLVAAPEPLREAALALLDERDAADDNPCADALDAICKAIEAPDWEYPGQVVRDVKAVVRQRDEWKEAATRHLEQAYAERQRDALLEALKKIAMGHSAARQVAIDALYATLKEVPDHAGRPQNPNDPNDPYLSGLPVSTNEAIASVRAQKGGDDG